MNSLLKGNIILANCKRYASIGCKLRYSTAATATRASDDKATYSVGQSICGYIVKKVEPIPEYALTAIVLHHDKTGAQHLHIDRDDSNNVFGVSFRTTPMDHSGVPHILEHTALCGSERFPVRDPFFKMLNRSLSTFMNALTASDWTMYPFSTQNSQDYENLMSVYLDAAFFPRLRETDFRQEGWRLEHENLDDPSSPIVFKGIVFNEMKGAFSNSQSWFAQRHQNLILPDHTYSIVSGGDPQYIPDLSWQELRDFHTSHYHPSNARFYTYGNLPLERHLQLITQNALDKFDKIDPNTEVPAAKRWTQPRKEQMSCSPDPMAPDPNKQTTVAVSYLLADITDLKESACLSILCTLLVNSEKSPFYRSLLEANIGSDFSPVIGYDGNTKEATFSVGLQGVAAEDVDRVTAIIEETIDKVIQEGIERDQIDAVLHRIELSQKHQADSFGFHLGLSLIATWTHDGDPCSAIKVSEMVAHFKQCLEENPQFLQDKLKQYFKNNPHKLTLVMSPDEAFEAQRQQKEQEKLSTLVSSLSQQEKEQVYIKGKELSEVQNQVENLSCLPSIRVEDVNRQTQTTQTHDINIGNVPVQLCEQPTNGVTYFRAVSNMAAIPDNLKPYVSLFCNVVTKMGTTSMDYRELSQRIDMTTGGLHASAHISEHPADMGSLEQGVLFSSYCLDRNVQNMFALWTDIFHKLDLSASERLTTLIMMCAAELANSVSDSGHVYAMGHAASSLSPAAAMKETMGGIAQVGLMKTIAEGQKLEEVTQYLQQIASHILSANNIRCSLNATPEHMSHAGDALRTFLTSLPQGNTDKNRYTKCDSSKASPVYTQFEMPFQVNFVSRSIQTVPYCHEHFASLQLLARLMSAKYLHREIREKGGAYGGGAAAGTSGLFNFFSYRDPNSLDTLHAFDAGIQWAKDGSFSQQDLNEAKLSVFSQVDLPVAPGKKGAGRFLNGLEDETRQQHRDRLFAASRDSVAEVTHRYLTPENRISSVSLLGPQNQSVTNDNKWTVKQL